MELKYYKKVRNKASGQMRGCEYRFEPVDIGWRWCRDELPEEDGYYVACDKKGRIWQLYWDGDFWWIAKTSHTKDILQWFKLPEPLKEEGA